MASVQFKKGLLANLPAAKAEGTFYVTTDERGLYLDVNDETRIRIGDFQEFANLEALEGNTNPSTTALYYVKDINCLAKWDGSKYVQINLDTGATDVEVTGDGNAITGASYNAATRKITLTKGATYATASDITQAITDLNLADTYEEKGAAAQAKEDLIGKTSDTKDSDTIKGAKKYADAAADAKDTAIAEAKKAGTDAAAVAATAQSAAEAAQSTADGKVASVAKGDDSVTIGGTATAPTVAVAVDETTGNALKLVSGKGLRVDIPAAAEYSIVKDDNSGDYAAVYHLTKGGVNTGVAINIPKDQFIKSGKVETKKAAGAWGEAGTYLVIELQNTDDILYVNVGDLIEYVTSGSQTGDMVFVTVSDDHKVTATITDGIITAAKLTTELQTAIGKAHDHSNKALLDTYTQTEENLADAVSKKHSHTNQTVLDGITAAKVSGWDGEVGAMAATNGMKDGSDIDSFGDVESALGDKAPLASPALTGVPTAPTAAAGTNTTQVATTAFVQVAVDAGLTWGSF